MKKRSKKLLDRGTEIAEKAQAKFAKVFWFFFSKKNGFLPLAFSVHPSSKHLLQRKPLSRIARSVEPELRAAPEHILRCAGEFVCDEVGEFGFGEAAAEVFAEVVEGGGVAD